MMPLVPKYATMHSVLSVWARCGQVNIKTPQHRGNRASLLAFDYTLGAHARRLSERVFKGAISSNDIVDFHSHVPMYASFMTALQAFGWRDRLTGGAPGRDTIAMGIRRMGVVEAETLRKCPTCVREDQVRFGCGHWRLFHQWPAALHCAVHGDELVTHCASCKSPVVRGNEPLLADDPCMICGCDEWAAAHRDPATGHWPLMQLMYRALKGQAPELSALVRAHPLLRAPSLTWENLGAGRPDGSHLRHLFAAWDVESPAQLGSVLGMNWNWSADSSSAPSIATSPFMFQAAVVAAEPAKRRAS